MTLEEAIKILLTYNPTRNQVAFPEYVDAIKLGIEALKMLKRMKELGLVPETSLLPGETID